MLSTYQKRERPCYRWIQQWAICAFTAAWERPEEFSRVPTWDCGWRSLSHSYPKYEPKPIRIYLQDGSNDNNIYAGDWWKANEMMERSFQFAGYDVNHVWERAGHNGNQGTAISASHALVMERLAKACC